MAKKEINWRALLEMIGQDFSETKEITPEIKELKERIEKNFDKFGRNGEHVGKDNVSSV